MEQLILAFEGERNAARLRDMIETAGLAQCVICHSGGEVKRLVHQQRLSAVVCGYKLPDDTAESLFNDLPPYCSLLVLADQAMLDLISSDLLFKLPAPATRSALLSAVRDLLLSSHRAERLVRPQRSAEEQAVIERAKAALIVQYGMSEEEAHRYLQKKSMDTGAKLIQTANAVLDGTL